MQNNTVKGNSGLLLGVKEVRAAHRGSVGAAHLSIDDGAPGDWDGGWDADGWDGDGWWGDGWDGDQ